MIVLLSILFSCIAINAFDVDRYAASVTDNTGNSVGKFGVDYRHHGHFTEGRAGVLFVPSNSNQRVASYPLFNGTFASPLMSTPTSTCNYVLGQSFRAVFDLSSRGWLANAQSTSIGSLTRYYTYFTQPVLIPNGAQWQQVQDVTVSINVDGSGWPVYGLNVTSGMGMFNGDQLNWQFHQFSSHPDTFFADDTYWAPPPDSCLAGPGRCKGPSSQWPVTTMDLYRSHDNSTWRHVLENCNTATAAGEAYFACHLSPGPFVTHFQVRLDTRWNDYSECNGGGCSWNEPGISYPISYGTQLGVGREESLGNNQGDGTGQCDTPAQDPGIGYWFSMNVGGMCPPGQHVGYQNCTWESNYKVIKTITLACSTATMQCNNYTTAGQDLKHAFQSCPAVNAVHWTHALKRHRAELRARQAQRERAMYEEAPNAYVAAYGVPIQQ